MVVTSAAPAAFCRAQRSRRPVTRGSGTPEELYRRLEERVGDHVDRCVLYFFRSSVYFAGQTRPKPELTKWWNWKDGGLAERRDTLV